MLYVQPLSDNELSDLEKLTQQAVGRVSERSWYILLSNKGKSVPEICEIFNRHPNCVRKWIKRYQAQGIDGLQDKQRSGRPQKVNKRTKEEIDETLKKTSRARIFSWFLDYPASSGLFIQPILFGFEPDNSEEYSL